MLQTQPPYNNEKLDNKLADNLQLKKSFDRRKRNAVIIPPYSADCQPNFEGIDREMMDKISNSDFWAFANEYVCTRTLIYVNIGSVESRLSYDSELMTPLTILPSAMNDISLKIFRLVFKICYDRERAHLPFYKVRKLIEILMNNSSEIKDECIL